MIIDKVTTADLEHNKVFTSMAYTNHRGYFRDRSFDVGIQCKRSLYIS